MEICWKPSLRAWGGRLYSGQGPGSEVHAGGFLRRRLIVLDAALAGQPGELARILTHELFHFVWLRLGNPARLAWESLLIEERVRGARGELGWSAEWRKSKLSGGDVSGRTRYWREYACESFCDSAAWLYSGAGSHEEFTLKPAFQRRRRALFTALASHREGGFRI